MEKERLYAKKVGNNHIQSYCQYFTMPSIAEFMCSWVCEHANSLLDPAVGNGIFFTYAQKQTHLCSMQGYEIDADILHYFNPPANATIFHADYLSNDWDTKYDAIVCNPPYQRFQAIPNRNEIIDAIHSHTGETYSRYTNLSLLFLIKSIHQLSEQGRLAYIVPSEFLNSKYGTAIKKKLLEEKLLTAIINFKNDANLFFDVTTTCCILLLERNPKDQILFYTLDSVDDLFSLNIGTISNNCLSVPYTRILPEEKWRAYLTQEQTTDYKNLTNISDFCKITRGIATGANQFFCLSSSQIKQNHIPQAALKKCICKSSDVQSVLFTKEDFDLLDKKDKTIYLLDIQKEHEPKLADYIANGVALSINKKHLPSRRNPWYVMEQKPIAPIWVSSTGRKGLKFVRNLANINTLTTFHSVYINNGYEKETNIIFCYFLTPIAQRIIRENRKILGNGLEKYQPNDLNNAKMLDITLLNKKDSARINQIYEDMTKEFHPTQIEELNDLFSSYLTT